MSTVIERVRRIFAPREVKAPAPHILMWPRWREGTPDWQMTDLSSYIEEGFDSNAIIYSAIMFKVRAAYSAALRAYEGTRDEPVLLPYEHELSLLCDRPNHYQSFAELQAEMLVYFNLMGNAYIWFRRKSGSEFPLNFYNLRPDWVHHVYDQQTLKGYVYAPAGVALQDGTPLLPQDVMHVRLPNPGDIFAGMGKGLSPISALARSADVDNALTGFLKRFIDEGAMPRYLLSVDAPLNEQIIEEATEAWMERFGGEGNWLKPMIQGHGATTQKLSANLDELATVQLDARNESRMAMPFGVPLTLIESRPDLVQATYSNKQQDYKMFLETTLLPELDMFQQEWRYFLRSVDGREFAQYDLSEVPGYIDKDARLAQIKDAFAIGAVTRAEYKRALGVSVTDADEVLYVPFAVNIMPVDAVVSAPRTETGSENAEEDEGAKALTVKARITPEHKQALWRIIDAKAASWEPQAQRAAREAFEHDRREILAIVGARQKASYSEAKTVSWSLMLLDVIAYLSTGGKDNWRKVFAPVLGAVVVDQGEQLNAHFGMQFNVRNLLGEQWFQQYTMTFADDITATSNDTLHEMFERALAEGWSVPKMERGIGQLFDRWTQAGADPVDAEFIDKRTPAYRVETIARTETMRASNAGADALYKDWGITKREWLATNDNRTRDTHREVNGQVRGMNEPFIVGGSPMMRPGDGPIGEVANCRCTLIPVMEDVP